MLVLSRTHFPTAPRGLFHRGPSRRTTIDVIAAILCASDGAIDTFVAG